MRFFQNLLFFLSLNLFACFCLCAQDKNNLENKKSTESSTIKTSVEELQKLSGENSFDIVAQRSLNCMQNHDWVLAFADMRNLIKLVTTDSKIVDYVEKTLDIYDDIEGNDSELKKNFTKELFAFTQKNLDQNQFSFLAYLKMQELLSKGKYKGVADRLIDCFMLPRGAKKMRTIENKDHNRISIPLQAIATLGALWKEKRVSTKKIIDSLRRYQVLPDELAMLVFIKTFKNTQLQRHIFKLYLASLKNDLRSSTTKMVLKEVLKSENTSLHYSAQYYLLKQNVQMSEYVLAFQNLQELKQTDPRNIIYTVTTDQTLQKLLVPYDKKHEFSKDLYDFSQNYISKRPLVPLHGDWEKQSKFCFEVSVKELSHSQWFANSYVEDNLEATRYLKKMPGYVNNSIFFLDIKNSALHSIDMLGGEERWVCSLPSIQENDNYYKQMYENFERKMGLNFAFVCDGVGILSDAKKIYVIDLSIGKLLWSSLNELSEVVAFEGGIVVIKSESKISALKASSGILLYSIPTDKHCRVYVKGSRLVTIRHNDICDYDLFLGTLEYQKSYIVGFAEEPTLLTDRILFTLDREKNMIALDLAKGSLKWSLKDSRIDRIEQLQLIDKRLLLIKTSSDSLIILDGKTGNIQWWKDLKQVSSSAWDRAIDLKKSFFYPSIIGISDDGKYLVVHQMAESQKDAEKKIIGVERVILFRPETGQESAKYEIDFTNDLPQSQLCITNGALANGDSMPLLRREKNQLKMGFLDWFSSDIDKEWMTLPKEFQEHHSVHIVGCVLFIRMKGYSVLGNLEVIERQKQLQQQAKEFFKTIGSCLKE